MEKYLATTLQYWIWPHSWGLKTPERTLTILKLSNMTTKSYSALTFYEMSPKRFRIDQFSPTSYPIKIYSFGNKHFCHSFICSIHSNNFVLLRSKLSHSALLWLSICYFITHHFIYYKFSHWRLNICHFKKFLKSDDCSTLSFVIVKEVWDKSKYQMLKKISNDKHQKNTLLRCIWNSLNCHCRKDEKNCQKDS